MDVVISGGTLALIGGVIAIGGTIFSVFFYFQKPQLALASRAQKLEEKVTELEKQVTANKVEVEKQMAVIKDDHSKNTDAMQKDIKDLTLSVNELSKTVVRLATIIEERIPKGQPNLTPPGQ